MKKGKDVDFSLFRFSIGNVIIIYLVTSALHIPPFFKCAFDNLQIYSQNLKVCMSG